MIIIDDKQFGKHFVTEVVDADLQDKTIPIVVFYHGWTDDKDYGISMGVQLAKRGIRCVIPDQLYHGKRATTPLTGMEIWQIVGENLAEFPEILDYYKQRGILDATRVGVTGYSMGGMTTYALLKHFPNIRVAASLMGNANPIEFAQWAMSSIWMQGKETPANSEALWKKMLPLLKGLSLAEKPEAIHNRPLLIWHGLEDDKVPYAMNRAFYDAIKDEPYAQQVTWIDSPGVKHQVPFPITVKTAEFLAAHLQEEA